MQKTEVKCFVHSRKCCHSRRIQNYITSKLCGKWSKCHKIFGEGSFSIKSTKNIEKKQGKKTQVRFKSKIYYAIKFFIKLSYSGMVEKT